ncbi:FABP family protein [Tropicimonas sp.]|uniref:FABP family protein n=1 Tax=Tropicimonas sp. TaxID=2067044 RepID=UPI003A8790BC
MNPFPEDIYTETPSASDVLGSLGPLRALAGTWRSRLGTDTSPKAPGPETKKFVEHIRLDPIDAQNNGPQLFYGLRYHTHINNPEELPTFHDQVGYWLWEPATGLIMQTLTIPRGQVVLAAGQAAADDRSFSVEAKRGATDYGICSTTFLEQAFRTDSYRCEITINDDNSWSYELHTTLKIRDRPDPFDHHDTNTLFRVAGPAENPLALAERGQP